MAEISTVPTPDGITWHVERIGSGPDLILVPSGEGDCSSFSTIANLLAQDFRVTTFDMPGFSRSTAPESAWEDASAPLLASQIVELMDALKIPMADFYGCSSGGCTVLGLVANHPERVRVGIVHEVPLHAAVETMVWKDLPDDEIVSRCQYLFEHVFCEDPEKWNALGAGFHSRLQTNYITWIRGYMGNVAQSSHFSVAQLRQRPLVWTLGALTTESLFFDNIKEAHDIGVAMGFLGSKHFPHVTVPEELVEHIKASIKRYS